MTLPSCYRNISAGVVTRVSYFLRLFTFWGGNRTNIVWLAQDERQRGIRLAINLLKQPLSSPLPEASNRLTENFDLLAKASE